MDASSAPASTTVTCTTTMESAPPTLAAAPGARPASQQPAGGAGGSSQEAFTQELARRAEATCRRVVRARKLSTVFKLACPGEVALTASLFLKMNRSWRVLHDEGAWTKRMNSCAFDLMDSDGNGRGLREAEFVQYHLLLLQGFEDQDFQRVCGLLVSCAAIHRMMLPVPVDYSIPIWKDIKAYFNDMLGNFIRSTAFRPSRSDSLARARTRNTRPPARERLIDSPTRLPPELSYPASISGVTLDDVAARHHVGTCQIDTLQKLSPSPLHSVSEDGSDLRIEDCASSVTSDSIHDHSDLDTRLDSSTASSTERCAGARSRSRGQKGSRIQAMRAQARKEERRKVERKLMQKTPSSQ